MSFCSCGQVSSFFLRGHKVRVEGESEVQERCGARTEVLTERVELLEEEVEVWGEGEQVLVGVGSDLAAAEER